MKSSGVLHVIASMDPQKGGVSKAVRLIISGLENHGIRSEVVTLDSPNNHYTENDSFKTFSLGPSKTGWQFARDFFPWLKANYQNYDAIILHGLWLYNGYAITKLIRTLRKLKEEKRPPKFYVMPHGMLDPYFQKATGRKLKAIRNWLYWNLIEFRTISFANGLLFTCEQEKILAGQSLKPYKPKREIIVGLGVEDPPVYTDAMKKAFVKKTSQQLVDGPFILFLGRINEKKGVDILIDAYTKISNLPNLVIAGPELESAFGKKLQKKVAENNDLKNKIFFTGMLSGDSKWGAFYGCEAFILPSHQENFGIAVVEAMSCGKTVLISNQVNIWREIKESGGGLVEEDSLRGVTNILRNWAILSETEKTSMHLNARKGFETYFSGIIFAKKIAGEIYDSTPESRSVVS